MKRRVRLQRLENRYLRDSNFRIQIQRIINEYNKNESVLDDLENAVYISRFFLKHPRRFLFLNGVNP